MVFIVKKKMSKWFVLYRTYKYYYYQGIFIALMVFVDLNFPFWTVVTENCKNVEFYLLVSVWVSIHANECLYNLYIFIYMLLRLWLF